MGVQRPKWLASGALGALWGPSVDRMGAILDHSWAPIGAIMGHLGAVRGRLGAISGPSWAVLGRSWTVLGLPWGSWSDFGNHRGGMRTNRDNHKKNNRFFNDFGLLGPLLRRLGGLLGRLGGYLGHLGGILGAIMGHLRPYWRPYGNMMRHLGRLGPSWKPSWRHLGPKNRWEMHHPPQAEGSLGLFLKGIE